MPKPSGCVPYSVKDFILQGETRLGQADLAYGHGTDNPRDEAAWLVGRTLGLAPHELDAHRDRVLTLAEQTAVRQIIDTRITTRKPAAYLLKEAWFARLRFYVDERVIVPRSLMGELILDAFQPWVATDGVHRVLDLCSGSGCIAIAAALAFPQAHVDATDISADALAVARINVAGHHLEHRVRIIESDLYAALAGERYDLILSNPPYVDAIDMAGLPLEYRHEPPLALASGASGLDAIVRILAAAAAHLQPGGILVAEVGNSCVALQERFATVPFTWLTTASGDDSVFMLTVEELVRYQPLFAAGSDHPAEENNNSKR